MPTYECPICHTKVEVDKSEEAPHRPFCSARCKLVDLGRWLNEEYRVSEEMPDSIETDDSDSAENSSRPD